MSTSHTNTKLNCAYTCWDIRRILTISQKYSGWGNSLNFRTSDCVIVCVDFVLKNVVSFSIMEDSVWLSSRVQRIVFCLPPYDTHCVVPCNSAAFASITCMLLEEFVNRQQQHACDWWTDHVIKWGKVVQLQPQTQAKYMRQQLWGWLCLVWYGVSLVLWPRAPIL